jgi:hypothetical protein
MAEIQGRIQGNIGNDDVNLVTNAATEFTLRQLLQATLAIGTKNEKALQELAKSAGYDSDAIDQLNRGTQQTGVAMGKLEVGARAVTDGFRRIMPYVHMFEGALSKLSDNSGKASEQFKSFERLGLGIGAIAEKYGKLMAFQEANMAAYQKLTSVGVNLGGSLSEVRESAGKMYLTLDQFSNLVTKNSEAFSRIGGGSDEAVKAFANVSAKLQKDPMGEHLRALGLTSEQVNQSMINYINITGSRTRAEMENSKALMEGTVAYVEQLDGLSRITGKSREQQEEALAEATKNAVFQAKLDELRATGQGDKADALVNAVNLALATGGKGAADAAVSRFMGVAPEKAGQLYISMASEANQQMEMMIDDIKSGNVKANEINQKYGETQYRAIQRDMSKYGEEASFFIARQGGAIGETIQTLQTTANISKRNKEGEIQAALDRRTQDKTSGTQAGQMAKIQGQMYEASAALNRAIQALVNDAMPGMTSAIKEFTDAVKSMSGVVENSPSAFNYLYNSLAVLGGVSTAYAGAMTARRIASVGKGGLGTAIAETSSIIDPSTGKPFARAATAESEALLGATKSASKALKGVAGVGTALTVGMAVGDYSDIEKKRKQGLMSTEDAKTQKGGVVGGAVGGLGGAAAGAAAGGAIGSAFFGVGAIPGAIIGGILGGFLGESAGKSVGENLATTDKTSAAEEAKAKEEEQKKTEKIKTKTAEENLLEGIDRLNTTMDKILTEMINTSANTEETAKKVKGRGYIQH